MFKFQKVNDIIIKPLDNNNKDNRPFKHAEIFNAPHFATFLCGKRGSGKTTVLYNILNMMISKETKLLLVFSGTHTTDPIMKKIKLYCKQNKINAKYYDKIKTIEQEITTRGQEKAIIKDRINIFWNFLKRQYENETEAESSDDEEKIITSNHIKVKERKPSKLKYRVSDYTVIIDDMSNDLKFNQELSDFIKLARHYKVSIIILSQRWTDCIPSIRDNLNTILILKNTPRKALEEIYKKINIKLTYKEFTEIYEEIINSSEHPFMYIDMDTGEIRNGLSNKLIL